MITNTRKTEKIAIDRFITKIEMDNDELAEIAWDNFAKVARCEAISEMMRVFYARNTNVLNDHKTRYNSVVSYGEDEDLLDMFRDIVASVDANYAKMLSDHELEYMAPSFFHLMNPAAKRVKLDEGLTRYLARKQARMCPICKQRLDFLTQEIVVDHDRAWCRVGDIINDYNLRAVHADCNDRKMSSYLAHTDMSDYLYVI